MMNEQELLDKFERIAEALERMAIAADGSTEAVNSATTARRTLNEQDTKEEILFKNIIFDTETLEKLANGGR